MKKIFIILFLVSCVLLSAGNWKKTGDFNLLLSQTNYSDNWTGSEKSNINWTAGINIIMEKQLNSILYDKNTLQLSFGQTHYQEVDENNDKYWKKPEITTDLIDYENMLTFTLQKFVDPFMALRWESKFIDNTDPEEEFFINPNTFTLSMGARKILINEENQSFEGRAGLAYKYFMNQIEDIDNEYNAGAEMVLNYWYLLPAKMGKLDSKLLVYEALMTSEDNDSDNWKSPDVEFVNTLSFKLSSYVSLKLYLEMLYDKEIISEMRVKENLGLNLSYSIF